MTSTIRVAAVGAGYFAQFQYEAWHRLPTVDLVATCNRTRDKAQEVADKFSIPSVFTDVSEMLAVAKPDLLDIITPPETHLETIRIAAQAGIDVICQKPYCTTLAEAREATRIADQAGIKVIIHENFRFQPWHIKIKELLAAEIVGNPYQVTFRLRPGDGQGPDAYLSRQPYFQKMERFLVHETAIHLIDVFRFLFGEVNAVYADLRRLNPAIAGEDSGTILFDFENGARGLFDGNRLSDHVAENRRLVMGEMIIEGPSGVLDLNGDGSIRHRNHGSNDWQTVDYTWHKRGFAGDCVYLLQQAVIEALLHGQPIANTAQQYLRNIEIEEAVYESSSQGCKLTVQ